MENQFITILFVRGLGITIADFAQIQLFPFNFESYFISGIETTDLRVNFVFVRVFERKCAGFIKMIDVDNLVFCFF